MALVVAVFAILLATVIGVALYHSSTIGFTITLNERDNTEAFYLAEAGYNHAFTLLSKVRSNHFNAILTAGDGIPGTGDELSVPPSSGLWTTAGNIPPGNKTGGGVTNFGANGAGRYWVSIRNDTAAGETPTRDYNRILYITSTGVGRDGSTATVEGSIIIDSAGFPALLVNSKLVLGGTVRIEGVNGSVHANDTITLDGTPCADVYFSSTGNIVNSSNARGANCTGAGVNRTNQPFIQPPVYDVRTDFRGKTDYLLGGRGTNAGKVFNRSGQVLFTSTKQNYVWTKGDMVWEWNSKDQSWIQKGNIEHASYYSEVNIQIKGNFGSSAIPAQATFIAEGYIYNKGKQYLTPAYQNISLLAGTDLRITGRLETDTTSEDDLEAEGIIYAHHQIDFAGSPTIRGNVIAANQADTDSPGGTNLVTLNSGAMVIRAAPRIISNQNPSPDNGITTLSWREVRR